MEKTVGLCIAIALLFSEGISELALGNQERWRRGGCSTQTVKKGVNARAQAEVSKLGYYRSAMMVQELGKKKRGATATLPNGTEVVLYPAAGQWIAQSSSEGMRRRQLSAFGVCSVCKCCDDTQTVCSFIGCCYSIVCNAPNQPFGLCSLAPSACDCLSCPTS